MATSCCSYSYQFIFCSAIVDPPASAQSDLLTPPGQHFHEHGVLATEADELSLLLLRDDQAVARRIFGHAARTEAIEAEAEESERQEKQADDFGRRATGLFIGQRVHRVMLGGPIGRIESAGYGSSQRKENRADNPRQ